MIHFLSTEEKNLPYPSIGVTYTGNNYSKLHWWVCSKRQIYDLLQNVIHMLQNFFAGIVSCGADCLRICIKFFHFDFNGEEKVCNKICKYCSVVHCAAAYLWIQNQWFTALLNFQIVQNHNMASIVFYGALLYIYMCLISYRIVFVRFYMNPTKI